MKGVDLDPDSCWRATQSRDRRFEGRFVVGVLSTRIYCRPGCPARMPRRENVAFFACAAAAEERGLRACLRCRPDASPRSPAALGAPVTVTRALRLIGEGHTSDMDELAARLGVGGRHLRRLFAEHLGASPLAVAQTTKLHFARKMLEETSAPVVDVAFAAGFRSVRRFNDAFRATFRAAPTALRNHRNAGKRGGGARDGEGRVEGVTLRLAYDRPLAWAELLAFLAPRATPGVEAVVGDAYLRTFDAGDGAAGTLEVRPLPGDDALALRLDAPAIAPLYGLVQRARRLFDLDVDPAAVARVLGRDPALRASVRARPGLRVPGAWDGFELAVRAVLGQQVTVAGATTLAGRLADAFGAKVTPGARAPALVRLFPTPRALAAAKVERIGLPTARAEAIRALARATVAGDVTFEPGTEEATTAALLALPGIGPWTCAYVAMRALGAPDALPDTDLGLRRALGTDDVAARAEAWRPWRAYGAMHVWAGDAKSVKKRSER
jgi:AraC family transcriptional regulator, regulatory protein of adaptative response / DNA-3-methyladenine glycosylase II